MNNQQNNQAPQEVKCNVCLKIRSQADGEHIQRSQQCNLHGHPRAQYFPSTQLIQTQSQPSTNNSSFQKTLQQQEILNPRTSLGQQFKMHHSRSHLFGNIVELEKGSSSNESPCNDSDLVNISPCQNILRKHNKNVVSEQINNEREIRKGTQTFMAYQQQLYGQVRSPFDEAQIRQRQQEQVGTKFCVPGRQNEFILYPSSNTQQLIDRNSGDDLIFMGTNEDGQILFDQRTNQIIMAPNKPFISSYDGLKDLKIECQTNQLNSNIYQQERNQFQDIPLQQKIGQFEKANNFQNQINFISQQHFEQEQQALMNNQSKQQFNNKESLEEPIRQEQMHQSLRQHQQQQLQYQEYAAMSNRMQNLSINNFGLQQNMHQDFNESNVRPAQEIFQHHQYGQQQFVDDQKFISNHRVEQQMPMAQQQLDQQYQFQSIFNQPTYFNHDQYQGHYQQNEAIQEDYNSQNRNSQMNRDMMANSFQERTMYQTPQKEQVFNQNQAYPAYIHDSNQLIPPELFNQKFPQTTSMAGQRKFSEEQYAHTGNQQFAQDSFHKQPVYGQKVLYEKGFHETESLNKFCEIQNPSENSSIQNQQHIIDNLDLVLNEGDEDNDHISEKLLEHPKLNTNAESYQEESLATDNLKSYLPLQVNPRGANSLDRIGQSQFDAHQENTFNDKVFTPTDGNRNLSHNFYAPPQYQYQAPPINHQQPRYVIQPNQVHYTKQQPMLVGGQQPGVEDQFEMENDINFLQERQRQIQSKIEHLQRVQNQSHDQRVEQSNYVRDQRLQVFENQESYRQAERQQYNNYFPTEHHELMAKNQGQGQNMVITEKINQIGGGQGGIKANHNYGPQQMAMLPQESEGGKLDNNRGDKNRFKQNSAIPPKRKQNQKKACSEKNSPYTSAARKLQQQKHGSSYQKSSDEYEDIEIDLKNDLKPLVGSNKLSSQMFHHPKKKNSEINSTTNIHRADLGPLSDVGDIFEDTKSPPQSSISKNSGDRKYQVKQLSKGNKTHSDSKNKSGETSNKSMKSSDSLANTDFDKFMQDIQTKIKLANDDPEKEFQVLDGHIKDLATKKIGSKFLQDHLKKAKQVLINKIQQQIEGHLPELMMDNYGNYFCSQLIENLQVHQRIRFLKQIKGQKFIEISCNNRGTYALQNIIQLVTQDEEFELIRETLEQNNNICRLAKDIQGQHMIQKIIKSFNEDKRGYIFDRICSQFKDLAMDKQGLCVMKVLIQSTMKPENRIIIVDKIVEDGLEYVQNEYGNFVVSEALTYYKYEHTKRIFEQMKTHFAKLSQNKFASKFIEICIDRAPKDVQTEICKEFCHSPNLHKVIQSKFGNFVLQKSIKTFQDPELIECTINSLGDVTQFQVQQKWGSDLLVKFINEMPRKDKERLKSILDEKMVQINEKYKEFKQHQSSEYSNNYYGYSSKAQVSSFSGGNKSSYGSHTGSYYNHYLNDHSSGSGKVKTNSEYSYKNEEPYASNQQSQRKVVNTQSKKPFIVQKNNIKFANNQQSKKSGSGSEKEKDFNQ